MEMVLASAVYGIVILSIFRRCWEHVVAGSERETLFRFWRAYVGVTGLEPHPKITVAAIRRAAGGTPVYEVLLG